MAVNEDNFKPLAGNGARPLTGARSRGERAFLDIVLKKVYLDATDRSVGNRHDTKRYP